MPPSGTAASVTLSPTVAVVVLIVDLFVRRVLVELTVAVNDLSQLRIIDLRGCFILF